MKVDDFKRLVLKTRSIRRFYSEISLTIENLQELVDIARQTSSARNLQPLKYILVSHPEHRTQLFSCLNWAKALPEWGGPRETERPGGYIIILGDKNLSDNFHTDAGIAAQTVMLAARTQDWGGCIIASVDRDRARSLFKISEQFEILLVIALGKPAEEVFLETIPPSGDHKYWRDAEGGHHVPKRSLQEVIWKEF